MAKYFDATAIRKLESVLADRSMQPRHFARENISHFRFPSLIPLPIHLFIRSPIHWCIRLYIYLFSSIHSFLKSNRWLILSSFLCSILFDCSMQPRHFARENISHFRFPSLIPLPIHLFIRSPIHWCIRLYIYLFSSIHSFLKSNRWLILSSFLCSILFDCSFFRVHQKRKYLQRVA